MRRFTIVRDFSRNFMISRYRFACEPTVERCSILVAKLRYFTMSTTSGSSVLHAPVEWAQRKDLVYVTICVEDCKDPKIDITNERLDFSGVGGTPKQQYEAHVEFFGEVDSSKVRRIESDRKIQLVINKKESGPFWPRLLKDKAKVWWCKIDFNKWKDEDDTGSLDNFDPLYDPMQSDFNFNGDMGDDSDSSDELPGLDDEAEDEKNDLASEKTEPTKDTPSPCSHPHLIGKDCVTPGISKVEYAERRENFWRRCWSYSPVKNQIILVPAATVSLAAPDVPYVFRQDSDFFYLTGLREPASLLILYGSENTPKAALFVAERNTTKELWDGPMAGTDGAQWLTGIDWAATHSSIANFVQDYVSTCNPHTTSAWLVRNDLTKGNVSCRLSLEILENAGMSTQSGSKILHELRWRKSPAEIELMRRACAIGSEAMASTIKFSRAGQEENVLIGKMDFECRLLGAEKLAYPPVVGAGDRANTIHYLDANQLICENELILMDAGCEFGGYVSDITRTWPSSTSFTGPQALLYDILYDCQWHLIDGLKQRRHNDLRSIYMEMLVRLGLGLQSVGILPKNFSAADMLQMSGKICPHHVGHYLGLDVHDTGDVAKDCPLEPGVIITVEPGLYFKADRDDIPTPFRGIGMRIEDDVLITDTGVEVLTDSCPKSRTDLEALRKG
ncbi:hypothetical protein M514_03558 [Trichuris suis]|uniref:CS domain-containing protein n=1 Tax=Trichuris suis TaxID=68888 RepID=A0A085NPB2_9BILA|nr:hypothetical protein M514_03558 [Trichuris suis]